MIPSDQIKPFNVMEWTLKDQQEREKLQGRSISEYAYVDAEVMATVQSIKEMAQAAQDARAAKVGRYKSGDLVRHTPTGRPMKIHCEMGQRSVGLLEYHCVTKEYGAPIEGSAHDVDNLEKYEPRAGDWMVHPTRLIAPSNSKVMEFCLIEEFNERVWTADCDNQEHHIHLDRYVPILGRKPRVKP